MDDIQPIIRYATGVFRRRWWLLAIAVAVGGALSLAIAFAIPPTYRSAATIIVEAQQIPSDLARSTVASDAEERVRLIEQRLTTRQNLLDLASQLNVFGDRDNLSPTERVEAMRAAVTISSTVVGRRADRRVAGIEIAFSWRNPQLAAQVANALLTQLLEQNVEQRSARASETLEFFSSEADRLAAELQSLEEEIASFKRANQEALPDSLAIRRDELSRLVEVTFDRETRQLQLEQRRRVLEEQIELGQTAAVAGAQTTPEQRELANLRTALAQQRAVFAETHPNIRTLSARISALEQSIETGNAAPDVGRPAGASQSVNLVEELEAIDQELERLEDQREADAARIERLEDSIARTPQVELELAALEREYAALQGQYRQALAKRAEAETGQRLEVNQQAERLEVIEQPQQPEEPVSPNRVLIAGGGGVLSAGLGVALMILAELLNPAIRSPWDLERRLELRPVVTIPYIRTPGENLRRRWTIRIAVLAMLVTPALLLFLADRYILPLPILVERVIERFGLDAILG